MVVVSGAYPRRVSLQINEPCSPNNTFPADLSLQLVIVMPPCVLTLSASFAPLFTIDQYPDVLPEIYIRSGAPNDILSEHSRLELELFLNKKVNFTFPFQRLQPLQVVTMRGRPMISSLLDFANVYMNHSIDVENDAKLASRQSDRKSRFGESLKNILRSVIISFLEFCLLLNF